MINNKKIAGIILMAGNSNRFGKGTNKNFELLNNKHVFMYSVDAFNKNLYIDDIIIAVKKGEEEIVRTIINKENICKNIQIVNGGNSRKESVYNCINSTDSEIVIIHDGARPAIKDDYINECIECMNEFDGATIGVKSKDTIKIVGDKNVIVSTPTRSTTWLAQTPQCFNRRILLDMHKKYIDSEVTDDCELLEKGNYLVKMIDGDYTNIKITTHEDLAIMSLLMRNII